MIVCIIYCMPSLTFVTAIINTNSKCREETLQFKMDQLSQFLFLLNATIQIFADRDCHEILQNRYKDVGMPTIEAS